MLSRQLQHKNKLEPLDYPMYTLSTHETGYYLERLTVLWQAKRMIINTVLIFFLAALFISEKRRNPPPNAGGDTRRKARRALKKSFWRGLALNVSSESFNRRPSGTTCKVGS